MKAAQALLQRSHRDLSAAGSGGKVLSAAGERKKESVGEGKWMERGLSRGRTLFLLYKKFSLRVFWFSLALTLPPQKICITFSRAINPIRIVRQFLLLVLPGFLSLWALTVLAPRITTTEDNSSGETFSSDHSKLKGTTHTAAGVTPRAMPSPCGGSPAPGPKHRHPGLRSNTWARGDTWVMLVICGHQHQTIYLHTQC